MPVWGTAAPKANVTVTFGKTKAKAKADADGNWNVVLPAQTATFDGKQLVVKAGKEQITLIDVVVGEVWVAAGQSNMEYNRLKPVILDGLQYRLVSPYEANHAALCYVSQDRQRAVLFVYDLHPRYREPLVKLKLQGLVPDKHYTLTEVNLKPGKTSTLKCNGKTYSGDYLMKVGIDAFGYKDGVSHVVELR